MQTFSIFTDDAADHLHWWCQRRGYACGTFMSQVWSSCVAFIPPCHPRAKSLAPLTQPDLDAAMPIVNRAAFHLGRHVSHPITLQYL